MPALALSAIGQAASPEQMLEWAPECFGTPGDLKLAALAISEPEGGSDVRNLRTLARRDGDDLATEIDGARLLTWRASWMAKLYNIFEGTSEIQRIVISNALGAAEGTTHRFEWIAEPDVRPRHTHPHPGRQRRPERKGPRPQSDNATGNECVASAPQVKEVRDGRQDDGPAQRQSRRAAL